MSKTNVEAAVELLCEGITGSNPGGVITAQLGLYEPEEGLHASLPVVAVKPGRSSWQRVTPTEYLVSYVIRLRLYVGNWDMLDLDLEAQTLVWDDRFRAAFAPDPQLSNTCLISTLERGEDNFGDREAMKIEEAGFYWIDYYLSVVEQKSKSASAEG